MKKAQNPILNRGSSYRSKFLQFEKMMFNIVSTSTMMALKPEPRAKKQQNDSRRIVGAFHDPKNINQLWILKYLSVDKYQIVNYATDDVIDTDEDEVKLMRGKQRSTQKIQIQSVKNSDDVRLKDISELYLTLDGIVTLSKQKYYEDLQRFRFQPVNQPYSLPGFRNTYTIMRPPRSCLDVQNGSKEAGRNVILQDANNRSNQRWIIDPPLFQNMQKQKEEDQNMRKQKKEDQNMKKQKKEESKGHRIQNFLTKLYLNVDNDKYISQQANTELYIWEFQIKDPQESQYHIRCIKNDKYLDVIENQRPVLKQKSKAKRWVLVQK